MRRMSAISETVLWTSLEGRFQGFCIYQEDIIRMGREFNKRNFK